MPELPDNVVYRRRIADHALQREIARTEVIDPLILGDGLEPHRFDEVLRGRMLMETHRHGKHVFAKYGDDTGWLTFHFGMTGKVQVMEDDEPSEYAYVQLHFAEGGTSRSSARGSLPACASSTHRRPSWNRKGWGRTRAGRTWRRSSGN